MTVEVLSRVELVRRSGSVAKARTLVRAGVWRRAAQNAYIDGMLEDSPRTRLAVLRSVLPSDVAVSHRTALWLLGQDVLAGALDVTVERGRHLAARPGVRVHIAALPDEELVHDQGLLRTSAARSVVDIARSESSVEAVAFGDQALRSGATTSGLVQESLERATGLRGIVAARAVVPMLDGRSQSAMESRVRVGLLGAGLVGLDVQYDVYDFEGHAGRADLHCEGVLIEYDGRESRKRRRVFDDERRRQNRLADTSFELRRFTATDYYVYGPVSMAATVRRGMTVAATRDRSHVRGPDTLPPPAMRPRPTLADRRTRHCAA